MTRDELIWAGARAIANQYTPVADVEERLREDVGVVVDAVEPLIRADERESVKAEYVPVLMEHLRILADLRAQVEALRDNAAELEKNGTVHPNLWTAYVDAYSHVLALFDGGNDD